MAKKDKKTRRLLDRRKLLTILASGAAGGAAGVALGYRYRTNLSSLRIGLSSGPLEVPEGLDDFRREAERISALRQAQTAETALTLRKKYEKPVFGRVRVWDLIEKLALCVDETDRRLYCASQLVHVQQILAAMEANRVEDPDVLLLALLHDLGKVALLAGERPENILGWSRPVGKPTEGAGLDETLFQFGHGELVYMRVKDRVPEHVAWTARYHNIDIEECAPFMDERDRSFVDRYLRVFQKYDGGFASPYFLPRLDTEKYRDLIESTFPEPILF